MRLALLALVTLGIAPGTFVRTAIPPRSDAAVVAVVPIAARTGVSGALRLTGAWELRSGHDWFGGFSALVADGRGGLLAGTDRGWLLDLVIADGPAPRAVPGSFRFVGERTEGREEVMDLESLARDPASGTVWAAFENGNHVLRLAADGTRAMANPQGMRNWPYNSGAEAMTRLADGRFVALAEATARGSETAHPALLFAGDPVAGGPAPLEFRFEAPEGYDPVDMTQLPDGRVLILMRRVEYALPARFDTAIAIADPALIRAGEPWRAQVIQRLAGGVFADNFEGIAFLPAPGDPAGGTVWLVADNNFSVFQRNLLVRFAWDARAVPARAAGSAPAP